MQEVTLEQILQNREARAAAQQQLLSQYQKPLLSYSLNIPGPVKNSPLIRRTFREGLAALQARIPEELVLHRQQKLAITGCEALWVVDLPPMTLKRQCVALEEQLPLGRLFDFDVLSPDGTHPDRLAAGGTERGCIVCGAAGRACAAGRRHSVQVLQKTVSDIMRARLQEKDAQTIGALAQQSLFREASLTPKPGLVDRNNSGSHRDMDFSTFLRSAAALGPYFQDCARIGMETADRSFSAAFAILQKRGLRAEQEMFEATAGVNTHKGAIFSLGILCAAAGRLWSPEGFAEEKALSQTAAGFGKNASWETEGQPQTAGIYLYKTFGIGGIRAEAARGFPSVFDLALPFYRNALHTGADETYAGVLTLLQLIAQVEDTNMLRRGGRAGARKGAALAASLLADGAQPSMQEVAALDRLFREENLSPGGCADLLAATLFVQSLTDTAFFDRTQYAASCDTGIGY